jgi:hypothetical protein
MIWKEAVMTVWGTIPTSWRDWGKLWIISDRVTDASAVIRICHLPIARHRRYRLSRHPCWKNTLNPSPWGWKRNIRPKHWYSSARLHGVVTQKTAIWIVSHFPERLRSDVGRCNFWMLWWSVNVEVLIIKFTNIRISFNTSLGNFWKYFQFI